MTFSEFFTEYKIGLKNIRSRIPWRELPLYRKICLIILGILFIFSIIFFLIQNVLLGYIFTFAIIILSIIVIAIDSSKKNLEQNKKQFYSPYSRKRMRMLVQLLKKYHVEITDLEKIDLLIQQAENCRDEYNPFLALKKSLKWIASASVAIIVWMAKVVAEEFSVNELVVICLQIAVIIFSLGALFMLLFPVIRNFVYNDFKKYNCLIYDLKQLKIFGYIEIV